jgi:prolyl 4-hydroxylase
MARPGVQRYLARLEFTVRKFERAAECDAYRPDRAERMPSTIADTNSDAAFRTSETCHFCSTIRSAGARIQAPWLNGIDLVHGEPLKASGTTGPEFKAHKIFRSVGRRLRARSAAPARH